MRILWIKMKYRDRNGEIHEVELKKEQLQVLQVLMMEFAR